MFFELIDGLSWGWLIFAHLIAIALIWIPLGYDLTIRLLQQTVRPVRLLIEDTKKGGS